jgi:hypothetical protein
MLEIKNRKPKFGIKPERIVFEFPIKYVTIECRENNSDTIKINREVLYWTPIPKFEKTKKGREVAELIEILKPYLQEYVKTIGGSGNIREIKNYNNISKIVNLIMEKSDSKDCRIVNENETILIFVADLKAAEVLLIDYKTFYHKKHNEKYNWEVLI